MIKKIIGEDFNMVSNEEWVAEKARALDKLEKEYIKVMLETKWPTDEEEWTDYVNKTWDISTEAFDLRNEIMAKYPFMTDVQIIDPNVKEILNRIRQERGFESITHYEGTTEIVNKYRKVEKLPTYYINLLDFIKGEKINELRDEFHNRHHYLLYFRDIMIIGPIISSSSIPKKASRYFDEIREAFALGLFISCIALCRAIIEMCLFDKLEKRGLFNKSDSKVIPIDMARQDNLYHLIEMAKREKLLDKETKDLAHQVRNSANSIIHPKGTKEANFPDNKAVLEIIKDTIRIIEKIYQ